MHSYGAMFCEVRVNAVTGEMRVQPLSRLVRLRPHPQHQDGASQFRGGIIMGLGLALMEETQFDERTGRIMNPSLAEYHVPVHMDVPEIDVIWTDIPIRMRPWARAASARSASRELAPRSPTRSTTPRADASATFRSRSTRCLRMTGERPRNWRIT